MASPAIKHIVDLVWDIELSAIDIDNLKAVVCDKAWHELPEVLTLKGCPAFSFWQTLCLEALQGQDGQDQGLVDEPRRLRALLSTSSKLVEVSMDIEVFGRP